LWHDYEEWQKTGRELILRISDRIARGGPQDDHGMAIMRRREVTPSDIRIKLDALTGKIVPKIKLKLFELVSNLRERED